MFLDELDVRVIRKGEFQLIEEFRYEVPDTKEIISVRAGFRTDFASIPRFLRRIITGVDKSRKPSVVHDWLYRNNIGDRKRADAIFRIAMKEAGMGWIRHLVYYGVRAGGGIAWARSSLGVS